MLRLWLPALLLGTLACATGVTRGPVDDDGGSGGSSAGGIPSTGGTSNVGGNPTTGPGGSSAGGNMGTPTVWINEIHYDNDGADSGEGVELAGTAGLDLTLYELELYNEGRSYDRVMLSGTIPDQQNGFGATWFAVTGLQNGPSDAVALFLRQTSQAVLFIGYEGSSTALEGTAEGMTATDMGVEETGTTPAGQSLQLTGTGNDYASFSWTGPVAASPGQLNAGQTIP